MNEIVESTLSKFLGWGPALYHQIFDPWILKNDIKMIDEIGIFMQEHPDLPIVPTESLGKNHLLTLSTTILEEQARDELRKWTNQKSVAAQAREDLERNPKTNDQIPDEDFIHDIKDIAGNVSNKEAQKLLAALLAEEIRNPGTFSYKSLITLKSMTSQDAKEFRFITPMIMKSFLPGRNRVFFLPVSDNYRGEPIYPILYRMQEIGLISDAITPKSIVLSSDEKGYCSIYNHDTVFRVETRPNYETSKLKIFLLTKEGADICSIMDAPPTSQQNIDNTLSMLKKFFPSESVFTVKELKEDSVFESV